MENEMKIGIYTPIHKFKFEELDLLVNSLTKQVYKNFVWIVVLNGEVINKGDELLKRYEDSNIDIELVSKKSSSIGELKATGVKRGIEINCDILLELDYDDAVHKDTTYELNKAAENPKAMFFYSNFAHFDKNDVEFSFSYGTYYGWKVRQHDSDLFKMELNEMVAFPPTPQHIHRIESAPNHLRAFKAEAYTRVGGYDISLEVGDDHDLICKMFIEYGSEGFIHIDRCLYYQRYDNTSTTFSKNDAIQEQVAKNYEKYNKSLYTKHYGISKAYVDLDEELIDTDIYKLLSELKYYQLRLVDGGFLRINNVYGFCSLEDFITIFNKNGFQVRRIISKRNCIEEIKSLTYTFDLIKFSGEYADTYWGDYYPLNE